MDFELRTVCIQVLTGSLLVWHRVLISDPFWNQRMRIGTDLDHSDGIREFDFACVF